MDGAAGDECGQNARRGQIRYPEWSPSTSRDAVPPKISPTSRLQANGPPPFNLSTAGQPRQLPPARLPPSTTDGPSEVRLLAVLDEWRINKLADAASC